MKRILFLLFLFALSINVILAQVATINIVTPNSNGLSDNQVDDFDVNTDGTILNNSASNGTAQLGNTVVTAHPSISAGGEASLILFQVTGTGGSDLDGTIEVFGGEAGLIIANPNGISCDGCGFINVNRVDLVTGSGYDADTNTFSTIAATDITVTGDALELSNVDLNIQTGRDFSNDVAINVDTLNITAGADFKNAGAIVAETVTIDVTSFGNDIKNKNTGTVSSDNLNIILTYNLYTSATSFNGFNFSNLAITTDGGFGNRFDFDLDNLTIKTGTFLINYGNITAASFTATVGSDFRNFDVIKAASFTATVGNIFYNITLINTTNFTLTAKQFDLFATINAASFTATISETFNNLVNGTTINADTVTIELPNFANINNTSTISSDSLNLILTNNFIHRSTSFTGFSFNNLAITMEGTFTNNSAIDLAGNLVITTDGAFTNNDTIDLDGNLTITANSFANTGGVLISDALTLSVTGDFNYEGTITTNAYNLNIGGDFSYDDSANDFILGVNDTLTVLGDANIVAAGFSNSGTISANVLNLTASTFANSGGVVNADTFSLSVAGNLNYANRGTIAANTYNLDVDGNFSYNELANDFVWGASDILTVLGTTNITAAGFSNSGTISANVLNLTASTFANSGGVVDVATFNLSVGGDFDYIAEFLNNGEITTHILNLDVDDNFSYNNDGNNFTWGANDTLTVLGEANIVAADFTNSGNINVTNSFGITAAGFSNSGTIAVTNSLGITVTGFSNSGTISASISFNVTVVNFINETGAKITTAECNIVAISSTDNGTITCLNSDTLDTTIDHIARPNSSGLSVNSYETFHIPSNGRIFNNSDSAGTSQLLGDISKNQYYVNEDAASIILAQVTSGTDISLLLGTLEVFGAEAVVIIANPNGISCNACSFINTNRVDLVTGSGYNSDADRFNNIENSNISLIDNGLDVASVGILNIHAGSFTNTGGVNADIFNLSIDGDFDDTKKGIINATSFNLNVGGDFSNNDASDDFVLGENDSLSISGDFIIDTNNYIQFGTLVVDGALTIESDSDFSNSGNITVTGALAIDSDRNFVNSGGITTDSLNITTGYTAINQGSIVSDSLAITANDFFRNLTGGDIDVATLNITAGGKVTNTANITVGTLNIIANNDSSRTNDTTAFYVSNRGNITATTLNIAAVDNFYNRGNITATDFNITRAKAIFFLNKEIDSFYAAGHTYDGGNISLNGDSSFRADGGIIENYGNIDLGDFNLDISADSFTNQAGANVTANTLNLDVNSLIQHGFINAVINHQ